MILDIQKFSVSKKRSVSIKGHQTSFTLEDDFWKLLKQYAQNHNVSLASVVQKLDLLRIKDTQKVLGLSSVIRQFLLQDLLHQLN
jgi:predicted DNA-binding ribbon-helix-helix protein